MKKLLLILLCLPLLFTTCKKEEPTNNSSASIVGTWEIASLTGTYTEGYLHPIQGTEVVTATENYSVNYPTFAGETSFWTFASDGGFTQSYYNNDGLMETYEITQAQTSASTPPCFQLFGSNFNDDSYLKDGNNLTIGGVGGQPYTITTLTNSTLSMNWKVVFVEDQWPGNDTTYFANATSSATFNTIN